MRREMGDSSFELLALLEDEVSYEPAQMLGFQITRCFRGMRTVNVSGLCHLFLDIDGNMAPATRDMDRIPCLKTPTQTNMIRIHPSIGLSRPKLFCENSTMEWMPQFALGGVVGLTRWIEKMKLVFNISGCAIENQVKFATCTLLGAALTWWNGQIRTLGPEAYAMTWEVLKKKMMDKYCPQGEIKKLEIELWNLKVKGNDVPAYTERFQELTLILTPLKLCVAAEVCPGELLHNTQR
ncbi:reverse transcriptase domain-containing protein [Tanacetum coccineum]